jgi:hypothetical protein
MSSVQKAVGALKPQLALGARGVLQGDPWQIIGYQRVKDNWSGWDEYLLFNPWKGFRFLVTFQGHWTLVRLLPDHDGSADFEGEHYRMFFRSNVSTVGVLGEFYWRVKVGDVSQVADYIHPPRVLSQEFHPVSKDVTWSVGEYLDCAEVSAAFMPNQARLPVPTGVYLNQPNPYKQSWASMRSSFLLTLGCYLLIQLLAYVASSNTGNRKLELNFDASAGSSDVLLSEKFELKSHSAPLQFIAKGSLPVDSYLGLKGNLVNAQTQKTLPLALPLHHYSGVSGGQWNYAVIPAVPAGEYYLRLDADASTNVRQTKVDVLFEHSGLFWSNFFLGLALICLWPAWLLLRGGSFESKRWAESSTFSSD